MPRMQGKKVGSGQQYCLLLSHFRVSDSVWPHRWQPTRLPCPWDSPGKNIGVGCHFLLQCVKVKLPSRIRPSATPWVAAFQAPPPMGIFPGKNAGVGCQQYCLDSTQRWARGRFTEFKQKGWWPHRYVILSKMGWRGHKRKTQRDGMGREEGGGFRMGNTCIPVADSFWCLAKLIQLYKV